jgi:alcohol dehydrogenase class IV
MRYGAGSLEELADVCGEVGIERPLLVTTRRGAAAVGALPVVGVYEGVRPHVPIETVREAAARVVELDADGLVGLGGGSAMDTCKAVVSELADQGHDPLPQIVTVPTTYAGAE